VRAKEIIKKGTLLIDALIGYHLEGALRGAFKEVIEIMNASRKKIIAYDIPSGLEPTTGECFVPCVQAAVTLSLALPKTAFAHKEARKAAGKILIADIGIPDFLYEEIAPNSRPPFERHANSLIPL
jgi:hydroxyethylthiazole kinase-like uncharacterized protein yjeF